MSKIKNKMIFNLILWFSIFALIAAYFIQYVLKHQPCNLCLIERIPYFFSIIVISIHLFTKKFEKISLVILSLIFFSATLIALYHFGVEQGFIEESLVCDLNNENNNLSKQDLLNQLKEIPVSCKNVTFRVFGLSLATFNIFINLILCVIITNIFLTHEKNR
tara:strand:+ start:485 stop:970 length:486 start_codon:yes stop_codon:yes gene_type:complete